MVWKQTVNVSSEIQMREVSWQHWEPNHYPVKNEYETFIAAEGFPVRDLDQGFAWRLCEGFVIQSQYPWQIDPL